MGQKVIRDDAIWAKHLQGDPDMIVLEGQPKVKDPYLASVSALLSEWSSPEDAEAYDGLSAVGDDH